MKKIISFAAVVALGISALPALSDDVPVSIGSNPVGNTAYQWAAGISDLVNRKVEGVQMTAEGTKGYVANVRLMLNSDIEAGFSNSKLAYEAYKAEGDYSDVEPGRILSWMSIAPIVQHVVVLEGSDIKTLDDLIFFPFGNGSERMFSNNSNIKSMFHGIDFNRHNKYHLVKSVLEGVSFSLSYGIELLRDMGIEVNTVKVGNQNLFKSKIFRKTFVNVSKIKLMVYETDGSIGAARGAGIGVGYYKDEKDAFQSLECIDELNPSDSKNLEESYLNWKMILNKLN